MAELIIHKQKIKDNIIALSRFFKAAGIQWSLITKVFSGDLEFLKQVLTPDIIEEVDSIEDSRLTSLKNLRTVNPNMRTIYIKPPAEVYAEEVVLYADISLNTSLSTIRALNHAAGQHNKVHEIIIMIELGELREGVKRSDLLNFYEEIFRLKHIKVIGLGSNLGCMFGIEPTYDKLLQLVLYKELIAAKFDKDLPLVSGGTSITLPLIERDIVPKDVNHFRIGEAAFFGISPLDGNPFMSLNANTFELQANIIELREKNIVPQGVMTDGSVGHVADIDPEAMGQTSTKAILDFGLLDVDQQDIEAQDQDLEFVGITSDMLVVDIGNNQTSSGQPRFKVGDKISFKPNYMAVARLLNSKFIDKVFVE